MLTLVLEALSPFTGRSCERCTRFSYARASSGIIRNECRGWRAFVLQCTACMLLCHTPHTKALPQLRNPKTWQSQGVCEPGALDAVRMFLAEESQFCGSLSTHLFVVLGAGANMGPFEVLMKLGANVVAVRGCLSRCGRPGEQERVRLGLRGCLTPEQGQVACIACLFRTYALESCVGCVHVLPAAWTQGACESIQCTLPSHGTHVGTTGGP